MDDQVLPILTAIGLILNVLSIRLLKDLNKRKVIIRLTVACMGIGFLLFTFVVMMQSSTVIFGIFFYFAIFLWNFALFEFIFIVFTKSKHQDI